MIIARWLFLTGCGWALVCGCSSAKSTDSPAKPASNEHQLAQAGSAALVANAALATATFKLATGDKVVKVEVVKSPRAITQGLMYRQYMPPDHGMLFLMGETKEHTFWMHNTLIALDMMFITKDFEIAGIVENATPQTDEIRTVGKTSLYVLEVNGGWSKANGVTAGTKV
ncbi:MAG: DUF192 domain-containing protein, partial [Kofleriaceae bacterium]|nr:DUF192 domain-containing protein [Kofleriaceae bacterium]